MKDDLAALRAKLQQLEALHKSGELGQAAYQKARAPLERKLVDLVLAGQAGSAAPAAAAPVASPRPSMRLSATLATVVLAVAGTGYWWTGSPGVPSAGAPNPAAAAAQAASPHDPNAADQFAAAVEKLAQKLKEQPDNPEGWSMLARSYMRLGRMPEALPAFAKAVQLRGDDPSLLADYADALAVSNERKLEGEPLKLIERALALDPKHQKALALAGTAAFDRKDFPQAVRYWELLVQTAPPDSPLASQVQAAIAEARQLGGAAPLASGGAAIAAAPTPAPSAAATSATSASALRGTVRLSPALAKQAAPDDTVFVFARAAEGPRMPLAIVRKQVRDLPFDFAFDDSQAMSPAMKLSQFARVVVGARVSKSGQANGSAGDLTGQSAAVANDARGVVVEINEVFKP
jgi:cytochrome c-type biogenesis protein CcmH